MTTKTFDSTISQIPQDDSSVEYVAPETNPLTTIQTSQLVFGQKHNDIDCATCPTAKRACDRAWVTAKQIEEWSKMSKTTLWRWLERIEKARRISLVSDMKLVNIPTATGAKSTTLYNLNVLNQLAMACIDNEKLNEVSCKFSDILSEVETTGSYGVTQTQNQPMMLPNFCNPAEAARAWADLYEKNQAIEHRALTAESERDEAVRTKALIGSNREATAMNTASQKSKECEKLREQIGDSKTYKAVTAISWLPDYFDMSNRGLYGSLAAKLKKLEAEMPPAFAHIDIEDSRWGTVKAYHVDVIERLHEMIQADENLMQKYRKIASV